MPGIVGIITSTKSPEECQRLVAGMTRSMLCEKFYVSGTQAFPDLGIYAGWVAHAGSQAAGQVFWNERRDVALLLSGECFPGAHVHQQTALAGGWLIRGYEERGEKFFESLNGLFSGLLVDLRGKRSFLFNDRYGVERLYWHEAKDATYFASEAKALLQVLPEVRAFDQEGVAQYLSFGCTLDWKTLFRGVQLAPGGSLWTIENGGCRRTRYFTPAQWESQPALTEAEFDAQFAETFRRILPRYFEASSPLGISLTGGLDTRMILAALPESAARPVTYTFAANEGESLDARIARRVAAVCGLKHELLRLGPDFFANFGLHADRTVLASDGCFGALGAHEIYLHEQARERAAVRLTGNYGSEVLRSMSTFKPALPADGLLNPDLAAAAKDCSRRPVEAAGSPVTFAAFQEVPWNLFGCLVAGRSQVTFRTPYLDNEIVKLAYAAPTSARTSPAAAVRFIKQASPALGAIATDRAQAGNPGGIGRAFRRIYSEVTFKLDYMCSEGLPFGLSPLDGPYLAFNRALGISGLHKFLQYRRWLQKELSGFVQERVASAQLPFWDRKFVANIACEHIAGRRNFSREINAVATLEAVNRLLLSAPK
jgi:asparagine synthase (glutamine-hydrolysing)